MMLPEIVVASGYPALQAFSDRAEQLAEFAAFEPIGPGVPAGR